MNVSLEEYELSAKDPEYYTRHARLREAVAKYCLPDQADKVILTILSNIQGYDEADTHRNVNVTIKELAESNLGI
jgi:hypothetical protein